MPQTDMTKRVEYVFFGENTIADPKIGVQLGEFSGPGFGPCITRAVCDRRQGRQQNRSLRLAQGEFSRGILKPPQPTVSILTNRTSQLSAGSGVNHCSNAARIRITAT